MLTIIFQAKIFFYAWNHLKHMQKNVHQNRSKKKIMLEELRSPKSSGSCGALFSTGVSAPLPRIVLDWIPLAKRLSGITDQRFWIRFSKKAEDTVVEELSPIH